jgi:hypothetical protein
MANPLLYGKVIKAGANALDYKLSPLQEKLLDPFGAAKDYLVGKAETAMGVPKDTISAVTDPKGFLGNVIKDVAKEKIVESIGERREIPEEDRSFSSSDDFGKYGLGVSDFGGGGGGGKSYFDTEGMSTSSYKRGGKVKSATKPKASTASRRGDGIAQRGKTRGRYL